MAPKKEFNMGLLSLPTGIEELKARRGKVQIIIDKDEKERQSIEKEIENLTGRLNEVNEQLTQQNKILSEYDRIISETESAYVKIVESSQVLLSMVRQESKTVIKCVQKTLQQ